MSDELKTPTECSFCDAKENLEHLLWRSVVIPVCPSCAAREFPNLPAKPKPEGGEPCAASLNQTTNSTATVPSVTSVVASSGAPTSDPEAAPKPIWCDDCGDWVDAGHTHATPPPGPDTPTPRTDAAMFCIGCGADGNGTPHDVVDTDFARDLEREAQALRTQLAAVERERDALREELNEEKGNYGNAELVYTDRIQHIQQQRDAAIAERDALRREAEDAREQLRLSQLQVRDMAIDVENSNLYIEVLRSLDKRFGCNHVAQGPDDCDNLVRHVDELQDDLASANLKIAELEKALQAVSGRIAQAIKSATGSTNTSALMPVEVALHLSAATSVIESISQSHES